MDLTQDLWLLWLEPSTPFTFKPGQYVTIGTDGIERAYSIVSAPHEKELELFLELVPEGDLTPRLYRMTSGDLVSMRPTAKGIFTMDARIVNHVMVATVTGVAPYVSILRDYLHRAVSGHRFFVLQGASYQDEFAYREELEGLVRSRPELIRYVPTVSRPKEPRNHGWDGETGRVHNLLEKHLGHWELSPDDTIVYACGHPGMIEEVKALAKATGYRFKEERFWKQ